MELMMIMCTIGSITQKNMKLVMDYVPIIGDQSLMIKDLPTKDWINQFEPIPKQTKRTTITDIHASKLMKKPALKVGLYPPCLT
jgi:hypothetical protein